MRITIHGTGYVGLVTGACFADAGHAVVCVDIDRQRIASLVEGVVPIYEPGLDAMIAANGAIERIRFTTDVEEGVRHGQLQFIAVGTPPQADGTADTRHVMEVARSIGMFMTEETLVVDKSPVPVGTADRVRTDKMILMDVKSAELTKYAANAMLATKISFINELALLADRLGAEIEQVRKGIGSDPRIGYHFIYPGCGYGGSCLPKDVQALISTARAAGFDAEMLRAVEAVNARQKQVLYTNLITAFEGQLAGKTIALWGLAFKPNTDDMRDAPSRILMEALWASGAKVQAYDPKAKDECTHIYGQRNDLMLGNTQDEVLEGADALVVCTEWTTFRTLDVERIKRTLKYPVIVDGRNLYDSAELHAAGVKYYGVGRQAASATHFN